MSLRVEARFRDVFEDAGLRTVGDVLQRATCVRDLPDRSNHELVVGDHRFFLKRHKVRRLRRFRASPEAEGLRLVRDAGVRTPELVCEGVDAREGVIAATVDLAPRRALDDVLQSDLSFRGARAITFDLARQVAALHAADLHHCDLYLNHWFVGPIDALPTCVLIDCERVAKHRGAFSRWVVKDLAAMESSAIRAGVSPAARYRFFLGYVSARGESLDLATRHLLPLVHAKAARMLRHVPKTPVGDAARPSTSGLASEDVASGSSTS